MGGSTVVRGVSCFLAAAAMSGVARADLGPQWKSTAPLVVDGVVTEVFRSVRSTKVDYIVEIQVRSAEVRPQKPPGAAETPSPIDFKSPTAEPALKAPAAGETVYAHVFLPNPKFNPQRLPAPGPGGHMEVPAEGDQIRAYLFPRPRGGFSGAYPDWFDRTADAPAEMADLDPTDAQEPAPPKQLGLYTETALVDGKPAQRVTGVVPGSAAESAGLRPGDDVRAINGVATTDVAGFRRGVARSNNPVRLTVRRAGAAADEEMSINFSTLLRLSPEPGPAAAPAPSPE